MTALSPTPAQMEQQQCGAALNGQLIQSAKGRLVTGDPAKLLGVLPIATS
jgi:hypothetical protein